MRAAVPHIDWRKLYEAAMLEMNPDKLAICIGAAEQAIAQQESFVDVSELERRKFRMPVQCSRFWAELLRRWVNGLHMTQHSPRNRNG